MLAILHLWVWWRRRRIIKGKWFLLAVGAAGPAAIVALESGWITTEVGRQPWIVYQYMRTADAVTNAGGIPVVWILLGVVYLGLGFGAIWALRRLAKSPEEPVTPTPLVGRPR
jgi:cytochrome d ubiquinol oxidase subunit I